MQVADNNNQSEHEFLSFCEKIKAANTPWSSLHVSYSHDFDRHIFLKNLTEAGPYLHDKRTQALATFKAMNEQAKGLKTEAVSYIFTDNDIILFAKQKDSNVAEGLGRLLETTQKDLPPHIPMTLLDSISEMPRLLSLGHDKIDSARHMRAIQMVAGSNPKRDTLTIRRQGHKTPLVMLVEDDRFTAAYTIELLAKDYEVFHVRSGEEAVEYYLDYAPDAVFIDLHLPGMAGNEALQLLRAIDPNAYCVILSSDSSHRAVSGAVELGAQSYLRKPYNKDRLLWTVRQSPHLKGITSLSIPGSIVHTSTVV